MKRNRQVKICFAASSGGHYEQLMMLRQLMERYNSFVITEKTKFSVAKDDVKTYYLQQVNRREKRLFFEMFANMAMSIIIYLQEKPNVIICTGTLVMIPMCLIVKAAGGKLIYIESFAKVTTPTKTGMLLYKFADQFYVQWPQMLKYYPKAVCFGGIY